MLPIRFNPSKSISSLLTSAGHFSIIISLLSGGFAHATLAERDQARRVHERLTGIPPSNTVLDSMEAEIASNGNAISAAFIAMDNPAFANVTLKNFAAPWTNEAQSVFVPLNDYTATVIGLIRDGADFRRVLYDNIIYTGNVSGISGYSKFNNNHYEELELKGPVEGDLSDDTILVAGLQSDAISGLPPEGTAGVMTTRAAAEAFFSGGTNRAMFRFTLMNHLCTDLEPLKDVSRVPDRVRQDVSRSPGGDSRIFMFSCVGCHAGMDGLAGAFAYYEYNSSTGAMEYTPGSVSGKHLINSNNFKYGYVTTDDSWVNYWRNGQNKLLNWNTTAVANTTINAKGHASGTGAKSMGEELANSDAFGQCQVKKAFKAICLHDPDDYAADRAAVNSIANSFMTTDSYNMKSVFAKVADYCKD